MKEKESDENTGFGVFKQTKGGKLHNSPPLPLREKKPWFAGSNPEPSWERARRREIQTSRMDLLTNKLQSP